MTPLAAEVALALPELPLAVTFTRSVCSLSADTGV